MVFAPKGVVVTGATSKGIGRSLALALHDLPTQPKVIITGRQQDKLDELASHSNRIYGKRLDQLSSKEELQRWVLRLLNEHQDVDTVILNAGIQIPADLSRPDTVDLDAVSMSNFDCAPDLANVTCSCKKKCTLTILPSSSWPTHSCPIY